MPTSVLVGRLRDVEPGSIVLSGDVRIFVKRGATIDVPIGCSVTAIVFGRLGVLYAQDVRQTPEPYTL